MSTSRLLRGLAPLALLGACLLPAAAAPAALAAAPGAGKLSPRLLQLASPALQALGPAAEARRLSLPRSGPASLLQVGNRVVVEVRFDRGAAPAVEALRGAGGEVLDSSGRYRTATLAVEPADLPALGSVAGVASVSEVLTPITHGADCGGLVRSEGDGQLAVPSARASWGVDGSGVTVGILSDSFDRDLAAATHGAQDVASGDLPGTGSPCGSSQPVAIRDDGESLGEDEGRAMAQIVHDLAPGAAIDFASAFGGQIGFAENIRGLAAAGARVIADDVAYVEEPFFQDGPVAAAINDVVAGGVSYFTAAGNENLIAAGNDVNSLEAQFSDGGSCPAGVPPPNAECADFDPGPGSDPDYDMTVGPGDVVILDLQWAEPWGGVKTDLDAYLLDGSGGVLAKSIDQNVAKTQRPYEILGWENSKKTTVTVKLAIPRLAGGNPGPRLKFVQLGSAGVVPTSSQYSTSSAGDTIGPTIFGHAAARSAITTGAVFFADSSAPEEYSSRGPAVHFFGPVVGAAPAPFIGEDVIAKPDLVASDCGVTTFFASFVKSEARWRFCGTSAAAPHAAAVAALMRQANPAAGPAQLRAALAATATPVGTSGPSEVGAGLVNAYAAVDAVALPPTIGFTAAPAALSRERRPTIQFAANRPVAFSCSLDGAPPQPCASPYKVPAPLGDGRHGFAVTGADIGGRVGASPVAFFTIDTRAPRTRIVKHPRKLVRTRDRRARVVFRFRANEGAAAFVCKVDHELLRPCGQRLGLRLPPGRHKVRVRAKDPAGNVDPTPAVFGFRVKQVG